MVNFRRVHSRVLKISTCKGYVVQNSSDSFLNQFSLILSHVNKYVIMVPNMIFPPTVTGFWRILQYITTFYHRLASILAVTALPARQNATYKHLFADCISCLLAPHGTTVLTK